MIVVHVIDSGASDSGANSTKRKTAYKPKNQNYYPEVDVTKCR